MPLLRSWRGASDDGSLSPAKNGRFGRRPLSCSFTASDLRHTGAARSGHVHASTSICSSRHIGSCDRVRVDRCINGHMGDKRIRCFAVLSSCNCATRVRNLGVVLQLGVVLSGLPTGSRLWSVGGPGRSASLSAFPMICDCRTKAHTDRGSCPRSG